MITSNTSASRQNLSRKIGSVSSTRQFWQARETPTPLFPFGILFLLGLFFLFILGLSTIAPAMQRQTQNNVASALASNNFKNMNVSVSGQEVLVEGPGSAADKPIIAAIAASTVCDTWAGNQKCPTDVRVELSKIATPAPVVKTARREPPKARPVIAAKPHNFVWRRTIDGLVLKGDVPSQAIHDAIVEKASAIYPSVDNQLTITNRAKGKHFDWAVKHAFELFPNSQTGVASWQDTKFSFQGTASRADESALRNLFFAPQTAALKGNFKVQILEDVKRCDEDFKTVLNSATVKFKTSSAEIAASSEQTIMELAKLAKSCPIDLQIEGHTDNVGREAFNQKLSEARAKSIVSALASLGVDTQRITAKGFGSLRPIAPNSTEEGRAENRRIEVKAAKL